MRQHVGHVDATKRRAADVLYVYNIKMVIDKA